MPDSKSILLKFRFSYPNGGTGGKKKKDMEQPLSVWIKTWSSTIYAEFMEGIGSPSRCPSAVWSREYKLEHFILLFIPGRVANVGIILFYFTNTRIPGR